MRSTAGWVVLAALVSGLGLHAQQRVLREDNPFRSGVDLVSITVTVLDAEGGLVAGLRREAFEVFEDGEPQAITQFTDERVPLSLALLLDVSDSMYGRRIVEARAAVERFLVDLLQPTDEFLIVAFSHRPRVLTGWTETRSVAQPALARLRPFGGTAIYDAVMTSLPLFQERTRQRAALLLISDGADSASDATVGQVRSAMLRSDAFAYAIAIDPPGAKSINTAVNPVALRELTDTSGGRTEIVADTADLEAATSRIADELNTQYVLGYNSPHASDGRYHSIRVRVRGGDYYVRARNGYVAEARSRT